jgi:DNA-binding response OmpR family regulator
MKTPLWDIDPFPTLIFDPDIERATRLSVHLVEGGVPVEIATSAEAMLQTVRKKYFRTLVVAIDLDDAKCLAFLDALRLAVPTGWLIAIGSRADAESHAVAYRHGVDSLLAAPASPSELLHRIVSLQLRSRPRF